MDVRANGNSSQQGGLTPRLPENPRLEMGPRRRGIAGTGFRPTANMEPGSQQGPGGLRGQNGIMAMLQDAIGSEASSVESLIGELPSELQGQFQASLQSIVGERSGKGALPGLQTLATSVMQIMESVLSRQAEREQDPEADGNGDDRLAPPTGLESTGGEIDANGEVKPQPGIRDRAQLKQASQGGASAPAAAAAPGVSSSTAPAQAAAPSFTPAVAATATTTTPVAAPAAVLPAAVAAPAAMPGFTRLNARG